MIKSKVWKITKGVLAVSAMITASALLCAIRNFLSGSGEDTSPSDPWGRVDLDTNFGWEEPWCDGK